MQLGDSNDVFIVVEAGLQEGDEVILNPAAVLEEAEAIAARALDELSPPEVEGAGESEQTDTDDAAPDVGGDAGIDG